MFAAALGKALRDGEGAHAHLNTTIVESSAVMTFKTLQDTILQCFYAYENDRIKEGSSGWLGGLARGNITAAGVREPLIYQPKTAVLDTFRPPRARNVVAIVAFG
jgi:hypothetical protein